MRLRHMNQLDQYLRPLDRCKGKVYLNSQYGDSYNLRSKLSQLLALNALLDAPEDSFELICEKKEDDIYLRRCLFA